MKLLSKPGQGWNKHRSSYFIFKQKYLKTEQNQPNKKTHNTQPKTPHPNNNSALIHNEWKNLTFILGKDGFYASVLILSHSLLYSCKKNDSRTNLLLCQGNFSIPVQFSFLPSADVIFIFLSLNGYLFLTS